MNINKIKISGTTYSIQDENACNVVELTQAEYDALPATAKTSNSLFVITDATGADLSNYYTKSETSGATQISTALASKQTTLTAGTNITIVDNVISATGGGGSSYTAGDGIDITNDVISVTGKVDTTTYNTYTAATDTALASKQDTLVSGTNIKTINNESILGSGNITIEGGGSSKELSAGTNISITTGETADTINCTLPITATTDTTNKAIMIGQSITASTNAKNGSVIIGSAAKGSLYDVIIGNQAKNNSNGWNDVVAIGNQAKAYSEGVAIGSYTETYNYYREGSVAIGYYARAKNMVNAVAIGHEVSTTGTTKTNINNQLTIDTSNQVYIYNKDNTEMICLQDQLGGGGSSYTAGDGIDITNDVISVTGKVDTSAITTSITSANTNTQVPSAKAVYDQLGGLKLVKLSQSAYNSLATKDSMTLYIIEEAPECNTPQGATYHTVDDNFDKTTQIYGLDFSNYDVYNNEPTTFTVDLKNANNIEYTVDVNTNNVEPYFTTTVTRGSETVYTADVAGFNFCEVFGEPMYISANSTIPSYETCVNSECIEYDCLQWDEETGECIEQGDCINSECIETQTNYPMTALY